MHNLEVPEKAALQNLKSKALAMSFSTKEKSSPALPHMPHAETVLK